MKKYRVMKVGGIFFNEMHYDYNTLVEMSDAEAAPFLSKSWIMLEVDTTPSGKTGPLPEQP